MSEQKQAGVAGSVNTGMVVGGGKHRRRHIAHIRAWGLVVLSLLVCVGAGWLVYNLYSSNTGKSSNDTAANKSQSLNLNTVAKDQTISNQALGLALNGKVSDAQQLLDNAIAKTSSKSAKGALYEQKSSIANGAKQYSLALQYAQKAESMRSTANSANLIAMNAEALGNKSLALKYYKLDLQRLKPPLGPGEKQDLETKITSLGGSV